MSARAWALLVAVVVAAGAGCDRERREFLLPRDAAERVHDVRLTTLVPGSPPPETPAPNGYEQNAYAMSEGKRLFNWYNCSGCHSNGGGGMGPPLMDDGWIYGGEPSQIFATIVEGRPNGMPSFRGKITDDEVWKLAAYVRSMSGNVNRNAAPTRNEDIAAKPAEQQTEVQPPKQSGPPP